ncbi:hypothetical protein BD289DRAFT_439084 [Coniella lustricola]|uniref:Uncharacterized protein n=1 Tax=Coniella lustricola TaxID=2025994 RepID=A0A2T3A275_9PEZI|nr:hypothetical protein BD289DRAFT_439084 [Coniella lustricola]
MPCIWARFSIRKPQCWSCCIGRLGSGGLSARQRSRPSGRVEREQSEAFQRSGPSAMYVLVRTCARACKYPCTPGETAARWHQWPVVQWFRATTEGQSSRTRCMHLRPGSRLGASTPASCWRSSPFQALQARLSCAAVGCQLAASGTATAGGGGQS